MLRMDRATLIINLSVKNGGIREKISALSCISESFASCLLAFKAGETFNANFCTSSI